MKPYYSEDNGNIQIYCGDCLELTPELELNGCVLFTDPPYGIDYDPKWLSDIHIAKQTKPNKSDKKVINDKGQIDLSFLFKFDRRLIWGFPYIYDPNATGWLVWDKQPKIDWRGITTPCEIASTTLRKGFDLVHCM